MTPFPPPPRAVVSRGRKDVMRAVRLALADAAGTLPDWPLPHAFLRDFEQRAEYRAPWLFDRDAQDVAGPVAQAALLGLPLDWQASELVQTAGGRVALRVLRFGLSTTLGRILDGPMIVVGEIHEHDRWAMQETARGPQVMRTPGTEADRGAFLFGHATVAFPRERWYGRVLAQDAAAQIAQRATPWAEDLHEMAQMMAMVQAAEGPMADLNPRWPAVMRCRRIMDLACGAWRRAAPSPGTLVPEADRARAAAQAAIDRLSGLARQPKWLRDQLAEISAGLGAAA